MRLPLVSGVVSPAYHCDYEIACLGWGSLVWDQRQLRAEQCSNKSLWQLGEAMHQSEADGLDTSLVPVYFSDVFVVDAKAVDDYGAFNVALVNDLPLFVDPFLLFDSEGDKYRALHDSIVDYLVFIKERAIEGEFAPGDASQWLLFKEVKQNWLGFSQTGNAGTGLGPAFARSLALNLKRRGCSINS